MKRRRGPATRTDVVILGAGHRIGIPHMSVHIEESDAPGPDLDSKATATKSDGLATILDSMSEKAFQAMVVAGLRQRGYAVWTVPDMRRTTAGLPDIVALGPVNQRGHMRLLMWELKSQRGRVRPEQRNVIAWLQLVKGVDARVVRPRDWQALSAALAHDGQDRQPSGGEEPSGQKHP